MKIQYADPGKLSKCMNQTQTVKLCISIVGAEPFWHVEFWKRFCTFFPASFLFAKGIFKTPHLCFRNSVVFSQSYPCFVVTCSLVFLSSWLVAVPWSEGLAWLFFHPCVVSRRQPARHEHRAMLSKLWCVSLVSRTR